jgi:hypothetical protein
MAKKKTSLQVPRDYQTKTIKLSIGNPVMLDGKPHRVVDIHWGGFTVREGR